jgi:hypothetical protein
MLARSSKRSLKIKVPIREKKEWIKKLKAGNSESILSILLPHLPQLRRRDLCYGGIGNAFPNALLAFIRRNVIR